MSDDEVRRKKPAKRLINRVFSRNALLLKVWGYDAYVGTRMVDIHSRRSRSKLGDVGSGIETVRNVGCEFARESQEKGCPQGSTASLYPRLS